MIDLGNNQKGSLVIVVFIIFLILGLSIGASFLIMQKDQVIDTPRAVVISSPPPIQVSTEVTYNWKVHQFTDGKGLGYKLEVPSSWEVDSWGGGHGESPDPLELANIFNGDKCGYQRDRIVVLHFISSDKKDLLEESTGSAKENGETRTIINLRDGKRIIKKAYSRISGQLGYSVYIPSSKGYYYIFSDFYCLPESEATFDKVIRSFDSLQ